MESIRIANLEDVSKLVQLEKESFTEDRRLNRRSIRLSVASSHQAVFVLEDEALIGAITIYFYKWSGRIYSLAIKDQYRGMGYGKKLLEYAENILRSRGKTVITLEADVQNKGLVKFYESQGYDQKKLLKNYYSEGQDACKMVKDLDVDRYRNNKVLKNIIVSDNELIQDLKNDYVEVVRPREYINDEQFQKTSDYRVFNLCNSYDYQSKGYYISLLGSARDQKVIPSVATMQDFSSDLFISVLAENTKELIESRLKSVTQKTIDYRVLFGYEEKGVQTKLSAYLYDLFETPFMSIRFRKDKQWYIESVSMLSPEEIADIDKDILKKIFARYFSRHKYNKVRLKNYEYSLAIMVNLEEENPPSNEEALRLFKKIGEDNGLYVELITKEDINRINEFDALLIRETTAVNNHTYKIARYAHAEGLIVIDDPWSILKCSNKFYLMERMNKAGIKVPKSCVLTREDNWEEKSLALLQFPIILKQPDSAFSLGVYKVNDVEELNVKCEELLQQSELIIAQEFLPSEFDWRIGVLDNEAIFACKYYMANGHWQIYNWANDGEEEYDVSGMSETLPVDEVPEEVIAMALRATSYIGDGMYGVDIKSIDDELYLIEVNDNPNIDYGIEDLVLGNQLYEKIILCMKNRIKQARANNQYIEL
ncbi:MAG: GNAT family N-acetyltransferase [Cellulosilyticaceae bacterium]